MKIFCFILTLTLAGPASATQEYILPTLFDVTGVAADDVLNVRAAPNARAEIIGRLAPDTTHVEVVAHDASGRWGQVNVDGRSGWASMRYLAYRTDVWEQGALPENLSCSGTEPFWSLTPTGDALRYTTPEAEATEYGIVDVAGTDVFRDPRRGVTAERVGARLTAVLVPSRCSDGMSDRAYGIDATVVIEEEGDVRLLRGCCSIAP